MSTKIYIDAKNGLDTTGDGSKLFPYQTLQYFCDNVASKADADYEILLQSGTYEITNSTIFGQFISGNMTIIGKGKNTEIIQKIGMYSNAVGGNAYFTLTIAKCKYNIDVNLTNSNLMDFLWKWNFYNVLFEYTPNNGYAVLLPYTSLTMKNCVKATNTTNFLRATDGVIDIQNSIGYFTSGYATSQGHWDKGGNTIGSVENYNDFLNQGLYAWSVKKSLILHDGEYKRWHEGATEQIEILPSVGMTSNTTPASLIANASSIYSSAWEPWKAFSGDYVTSGSSATAWISSNGVTNGHLQIDFGEQKRVTGFKLTPRNYYEDGIYNVPKDFVLQGSNNGILFVDIETYANQINWTQTEQREFKLNNPVAFRYFRLQINSITGGGAYSYIAIGQLSFINKIENSPSSFKTISHTLPTSTQFLAEGINSLSSQFDRKVTTLEPMPMLDKSEILNIDEVGKVFSKTIDFKKYFDVRKIYINKR